MSSVVSFGQRAQREALSVLESLAVGILLAMVLIWTIFQVVELQSVFPPIGILYALGSIMITAVIVVGRRRWSPALAAGWAVLMLIPESIPAIGHLTEWSEIYTHFAHYLIIMTFFPLAMALATIGIMATVQNYRHEPENRPAPNWLRGAMLAVASFIVIANAVVVALYLFDIP